MATTTVWVQLYIGNEASGEAFKIKETLGDVAELKDAVKAFWEESNKLKGIVAADGNGGPMKEGLNVTEQGVAIPVLYCRFPPPRPQGQQVRQLQPARAHTS